MPLALLAALAGSLAIHAAALFLPDVDLSAVQEPAPITAELQPPPAPPAKLAEPVAPKPQAERSRSRPARPLVSAPQASQPPVALPESEPVVPAAAPVQEPSPAAPEPPPVEPQLPASGYVRFSVYKGLQGFEIGRAEHRWEFADGRYRLVATMETTGLAAWLKPVRSELESRGRLTAQGLRPEALITRDNGRETSGKVDFDWDAHRLTLGRDGSQRELDDGAQDVVSFHYQLAYLAGLTGGATMGVATARKYERYRFDSLGEEYLDTPAGRFRTLHLRARTDSTTEVWLALDRRLLPVKIRHADKKGDSFEQVATEIGM